MNIAVIALEITFTVLFIWLAVRQARRGPRIPSRISNERPDDTAQWGADETQPSHFHAQVVDGSITVLMEPVCDADTAPSHPMAFHQPQHARGVISIGTFAPLTLRCPDGKRVHIPVLEPRSLKIRDLSLPRYHAAPRDPEEVARELAMPKEWLTVPNMWLRVEAHLKSMGGDDFEVQTAQGPVVLQWASNPVQRKQGVEDYIQNRKTNHLRGLALAVGVVCLYWIALALLSLAPNALHPGTRLAGLFIASINAYRFLYHWPER
jgi:hypothetical protein